MRQGGLGEREMLMNVAGTVLPRGKNGNDLRPRLVGEDLHEPGGPPEVGFCYRNPVAFIHAMNIVDI